MLPLGDLTVLLLSVMQGHTLLGRVSGAQAQQLSNEITKHTAPQSTLRPCERTVDSDAALKLLRLTPPSGCSSTAFHDRRKARGTTYQLHAIK